MVDNTDEKEDDTKIRDIFQHENEYFDNWKKTGAFMLKFFKDGSEEYVIIDDYLPVDS